MKGSEMIEWFWVLVVGLLALLAGFWVGGWSVRRNLAEDLAEARRSRETLTEQAAEAKARIKALEIDLAGTEATLVSTRQELDGLAPQLAGLSSSNADLKQAVAEANGARRAAEASLAARTVERDRSIEQAAVARASAIEADEKYESITAEFVTLKRSVRDAVDRMAKAEAERDESAAAAVHADRIARDRVAEAERDKTNAVALAIAERDEAVRAAEATNQWRADAGTLRSEIMSAQRELADLREEIARKDRQIKDLERRSTHAAHELDTTARAFSGFDPEAGAALSDEDLATALAAVPPPPAGVTDDAADDDDNDDETSDDDGDDDDILTVDDLPGGDWDPEAAAVVISRAVLTADTPEAADQDEGADSAVEVPDANVEPDEQPDNLRLIKGIGPKFEKLLHARNVTSFRQIAELADDAEWEAYLDTFAGRIEREEWREQAASLDNQTGG